MASYQYVYHMDGVSKTYPGGKKVFENIHLNFLPGVKIGVVGVNGAGKSTLLRVMAGWIFRERHGPPRGPRSATCRRNPSWKKP
jgi:ATPase subunit of ABC transporter with duplicated ATPase domains